MLILLILAMTLSGLAFKCRAAVLKARSAGQPLLDNSLKCRLGPQPRPVEPEILGWGPVCQPDLQMTLMCTWAFWPLFPRGSAALCDD